MISNRKFPEAISRLADLSMNLWWSWDHRGRSLFRNLDYPVWMDTKHNVVDILERITDETLEEKAKDPVFLEQYNQTIDAFDSYQEVENRWYAKNIAPETKIGIDHPIAYFSFEFGLHQSLPIYSGGLGILAGDICKESSDLGLPFVAIGLFYKEGYFTQRLPPHGWQESEFLETKLDNLAIKPVMDGESRLKLKIQLAETGVSFQVWKINVGNVSLYLMDTDIDDNDPWFRGLTARLYGGDNNMRLHQEMLFGIGGVTLLDKLKISPSVWHLNEGHCSFVSVERIAKRIRNGMDYSQALEEVRATTVFTTHTPVPAGHDQFDINHISEKMADKIKEMGISREEFIMMGINPDGDQRLFNMTVLGIKTAHLINGVSELHAEVTKKMWSVLLDEYKDKTKLLAITNGVHLPTFLSGPMRRLYDKYLGEDWQDHQDEKDLWKKVEDIPDEEFWDVRLQVKKRLLEQLRETAREFRLNGYMGADQILAYGTFFNPESLTIGFARRFATYKRANLIFSDLERIRKLFNNRYNPLQIIFAGKAHPADEPGKHILQQVYEQAMSPLNSGRVAFIENYDMHIARFLVQGVDVWLNNPVRPYEASGTSGMKAAANGVPHFSTFDGWWAEGFAEDNGWVIGGGKEFEKREEQDAHDAESLYTILEQQVVPTYYDQENGVSKRWIKLCKRAIAESIPNFSATRMMKDYVNKMYLPTIKNFESINQ